MLRQYVRMPKKAIQINKALTAPPSLEETFPGMNRLHPVFGSADVSNTPLYLDSET
jgi:hypothetical protein